MFRSVLVPLDGSPLGEGALPLAASVASGSSCRLHLVHVYDRQAPAHLLSQTQFHYEGLDIEGYVERYHDLDRKYLIQAAERVEADLPAPPLTALLEGDVVAAVGKYAAEAGGDLVVMGTHGRTGFRRAWLGSVADALVRGLSLPVLLVRPEEETGAVPEYDIRRILVAVDRSEEAMPILRPAVDLASALGASLTLLHVNPLRVVVGARSYPVPAGRAEERRREASQALRELAEGVAEDVTVDIAVRDHEAPALGLLEALDELGAGAIALATHGRTGLTRAAVGSVTDKVLRGSGCPVLLARLGSADASAA